MNQPQNPRQRRAELHAKYLQLQSAEELTAQTVGQICAEIRALVFQASKGGKKDSNSGFSGMAGRFVAQLKEPYALRGVAEFIGELTTSDIRRVKRTLDESQWMVDPQLLLQRDNLTDELLSLSALYHNLDERFLKSGPEMFRVAIERGITTAWASKELERGRRHCWAWVISKYPGIIFDTVMQEYFEAIMLNMFKDIIGGEISSLIGALRITFYLDSIRTVVVELKRPAFTERGRNPVSEAREFQAAVLSTLAKISAMTGVKICSVHGGYLLDPEAVSRQFDPTGDISSALDELFGDPNAPRL